MKIMKNNWIEVAEKDFDDLPETDAVYLIVIRNNDEKIVFYTGQTININRRAKEHWSENEENGMIKNIISNYKERISLYYYLDHGNALDGHERFLFNHFEPQAQSRAPEIDEKPISLPPNVIKAKLKSKCFE